MMERSVSDAAPTAAQLRRATIAVVCERGYAEATPAEICARAGVGTEEFDIILGSKADAVADIFEDLSAQLLHRCRVVYDTHTDWVAGLRAAGLELAQWILEHPQEARFAIAESVYAGERVQLLREAVLAQFAGFVDGGRLGGTELPPPAAAEAIVGAVAGIISRRLSSPRALGEAEMTRAFAELLYFALRPYVGHDRAARELVAPVAIPSPGPVPPTLH